MATTRASKSKLLAVAPESVEPKHPKVLIYGPPGVRKTWVSMEWPGAYYFDHEGGADLAAYRAKLKDAGGMYLGIDQGALDFDTVIGQVEALAVEQHPYKTMIFDSVTKLFNSAIADEQSRLGDKDAFGASKKAPIRQMAKLVSWVNRADLNGIFICHQTALWGLNAKGERAEIGTTFDAWPKLEYELHLVLRIGMIGSGENAKYMAYIGKSRLPSFPTGTSFEWSYAAFAERYGRDVIERAPTQIVLATAEQTAEVATLLERVKVPDGWATACFKKADVDEWAEMDGSTIEKCIAYLKERAAPPVPPAAEAKPKDAAA